MSRTLIVFVAKASALTAIIYLALAAGNYAMFHDGTWKQYQDCRYRLLWDRIEADDKIVLLGDSEFISNYTDKLEDTIWKHLEVMTNSHVFPGALDGTRDSDLTLATKLVAQQGRGRIIIIDLVPTRFLRSNNNPSNPSGNYKQQLEGKLVTTFSDAVYGHMFGSMPILNKDVFSNTLRKKFPTRGKNQRDFKWTDENAFAIERLRTFERFYRGSDNLGSFDLVARLNDIITRSGNEAVFVITPINEDLLRWYTAQGHRNYINTFDTIHDQLLSYFNCKGIRFLDLYKGLDSECFVDLLHTNACGDRHIARKTADYLLSKGLITTAQPHHSSSGTVQSKSFGIPEHWN